MYGRYKAKGQVLISVMGTVTKNMLPSFRIIAYYHTNDNEVVSDSVWVDAKDSCMGSVSHTTLIRPSLGGQTIHPCTMGFIFSATVLSLTNTSMPPPLVETGIIKI